MKTKAKALIPTGCRKIKTEDIKKTLILINLIVAFVSIFVLYFAFFRDSINYVLQANQEMNTKKKLYDLKNENLIKYESNCLSLEKLDKEMDRLSMKIVPYKEISTAIERVSDMMKRCNIQETYFYSGDYEEIPISGQDDQENLYIIITHLNGIGRYKDIIAFINAMNEADTYYSIDELELSVDDSQMSDIAVNLQISFYAYRSVSHKIQEGDADIVNEAPFK